jgi:hypothetical protein
MVHDATGLARADHALVVFSDVEMGTGGETDDFPNTGWLAELFTAYCEGRWADLPLDLVFNGDTFDLLKTPVDGRYVHLVDQDAALAKLEAVIAAHPFFFRGLREVLGHTRARRRVIFTVGNHDFELLFPALQERIRREVGGDADQVLFPGWEIDIGDVHIEHGSQADPLFRVEPATPFVTWEGREVLNLPWGAVALIDVAMPLHRILYACDRARPLTDVLARLPEVRSLLLDRYWQYWTRDWLGAWWSASDPMKRVSWTIFRQVARRLQSGDASVQLDPARYAQIAGGPHRLILLGHLHDPAWVQVGHAKVLRTGCMRDEFRLEADGRIGDVLPKVYAEVLLDRGKVFRSQLVEVEGEPGIAAAMPASIDEVRTGVAELREQLADQAGAQEAQLAHESRAPESEPNR